MTNENLSFFSPTLAITYLTIGVYLNSIIKLVAVMAKNSMVHKGRSGRIQEKSIVERFFSWIESCKKVFPRYEIKETSYLRVVMVAAIIRLNEVLG